jgi:hypothetical protein
MGIPPVPLPIFNDGKGVGVNERRNIISTMKAIIFLLLSSSVWESSGSG